LYVAIVPFGVGVQGTARWRLWSGNGWTERHHSVVGRGRTGILLASNRAWVLHPSPCFFDGGGM